MRDHAIVFCMVSNSSNNRLLMLAFMVLTANAFAVITDDSKTVNPKTMPAQTFDVSAATRFADLALACVHKEYPNKISHNLSSDADVAPPRKLTPAFYGCYDWHSSVHGHWLLVRLARTFPNAGFTPAAREALKQSLTAGNVLEEAKYL